MAFGLLLLCQLVVLLLVGVLPAAGGTGTAVFHSPVFLGIVGVALAVMMVALWRARRCHGALRLWLLHGGLVVVVVGAAIDYRWETRGSVTVPLVRNHVVRQVVVGLQDRRELPFSVGVTQVDAEYYLPEYELSPGTVPPGGGAPRGALRFRVSAAGSVLRLGPADVVPTEALQDEGGLWRDRVPLPDGRVLSRLPAVPRNYHVALKLTDATGVVRDVALSVNHPAEHLGWRLYVTSVEEGPTPVVRLTARRAPGRVCVTVGIWMVLLGVAAQCLSTGCGHEPH